MKGSEEDNAGRVECVDECRQDCRSRAEDAEVFIGRNQGWIGVKISTSLEGPMSSCHSKVPIVPPKFARTAAPLTIFSRTSKRKHHLVSICHTLQYNVSYEEM